MRAPSGRILVRTDSPPVSSEAGVLFPDGYDPGKDGNVHERQPERGVVLSVGDPIGDRPAEVAEGDVILFTAFGGAKVDEPAGILSLTPDEVLAVEVPPGGVQAGSEPLDG